LNQTLQRRLFRMTNRFKNDRNLERLLAVKRHEMPSSDHFDLMSEKIIARLEAERARTSESWSARLSRWVDNINPVVAFAYLTGVLALLAGGWRFGEHFLDDEPVRAINNAGLWVENAAGGEFSPADEAVESGGGLLEDFFLGLHTGDLVSRGRQSSIQPVIHIPDSPLFWLQDGSNPGSGPTAAYQAAD